ncbi:DUF2970 domain-containing protein [Bordetella sp. 2513F-2]
MTQPPQGPQPRAGFVRVMKAVLWGLLGVRKGEGSRDDAARLNPVHLIVAGVLAAAVFVLGLLLIVRWAVSSLS